ncbi:hypothetical protein UFOVP201_14 [uncultured Caudovirales phage]|uniref:Uncharacterized protein n=1 Tax=uncultured Caudovirales phage TaxID=2100421 RepID=A0A6J7WQT6_9CAUD|nr:hypothetical protein UFOVP201_14 [uncultured Caudovirales phage]
MKYVLTAYRNEIASLNETNSCTIITLANVTGISYLDAHKIGADAGRINRKGFYTEKLTAHALKFGHVFRPIANFARMSITAFCEKYPTGRFYVRKRGHAFAIINGVVHDNGVVDGKSRTIINAAYQLENGLAHNDVKVTNVTAPIETATPFVTITDVKTLRKNLYIAKKNLKLNLSPVDARKNRWVLKSVRRTIRNIRFYGTGISDTNLANLLNDTNATIARA